MIIASPQTARKLLRRGPGVCLPDVPQSQPQSAPAPTLAVLQTTTLPQGDGSTGSVVPTASTNLRRAHVTLLKHGYQPAAEYSDHDLSRAYEFPGVNLVRLWQQTGPDAAGGGVWFDSAKTSTASNGQHKHIPASSLERHLQQVQQFHAPDVEAAYSPQEPRNQEGEWTDGNNNRAAKAKASYKPSTREKQLVADHWEAKLSKGLGIARTKNNSAFDLTNDKIGIEIKTVQEKDRNDQINMHVSSRKRKEKEAKKNKLRAYTVGIDVRGDKPVYYWRKGVGAFRLGSMNVAHSLAELKRVIT